MNNESISKNNLHQFISDLSKYTTENIKKYDCWIDSGCSGPDPSLTALCEVLHMTDRIANTYGMTQRLKPCTKKTYHDYVIPSPSPLRIEKQRNLKFKIEQWLKDRNFNKLDVKF